MRPRTVQQSPRPATIDVLDIPDEILEDDADAPQALVAYRGERVSVKQALAKMAAEDLGDADDTSAEDDWDIRGLRASLGSGYSDDSLPEFDPFDD
jgi:hypothetical protein